MGSSSELTRGSGKYRSDVIIPWGLIPSNVWNDLVVKLNPDMAIGGKDWRMLASKLGLNQGQIMFIESEKDTNTNLLFKMYSQRQESSVNEIYTCLEEMGRRDCLEIIDKAYEEMYKKTVEKPYEHKCYHTDGAEGAPFSGQYSCYNSHHQSGVLRSPSHCACFCSLPYHHLPHPHPPMSQPPFLHDKNGTFAPHHSPQHSPTIEHGCLAHSQRNHPLRSMAPDALHNNISPFDNNSNITGNFNSLETMNTQAKMARQYSDECNVSQGCAGEDRPYQNSKYPLDFTNGNLPGQKGHVVNPQHSPVGSHFVPGTDMIRGRQQNTKSYHPNSNYVNGQMYPADGFRPRGQGPSSPGADSCGKGEQSLAMLKSMVYRSEKYRPTPEYKDVVANQKIDPEKKKKSEKDSLDSFGSHSSSGSSGSSSGRSSRPSSTFPLRIKNRTSVEDISQLKISKKSTSMPQNMKPAEYRKVFRNTKVFVTYSFDNESHGKQVLSLCKFLQTNGFACYVDVKEKDTTNRIDWCSKKMFEADFILVCISPKYLQDIKSGPNRSFQPGDEKQLHTKEIYALMENEHLKGNGFATARQPQIVPLLFGGMQATSLPQWMTTDRPKYVWPEEYLDLAWLLTKPQERIKVSRGCTNGADSRGHDTSSASSMDHENMNVDCYS